MSVKSSLSKKKSGYKPNPITQPTTGAGFTRYSAKTLAQQNIENVLSGKQKLNYLQQFKALEDNPTATNEQEKLDLAMKKDQADNQKDLTRAFMGFSGPQLAMKAISFALPKLEGFAGYGKTPDFQRPTYNNMDALIVRGLRPDLGSQGSAGHI